MFALSSWVFPLKWFVLYTMYPTRAGYIAKTFFCTEFPVQRWSGLTCGLGLTNYPPDAVIWQWRYRGSGNCVSLPKFLETFNTEFPVQRSYGLGLIINPPLLTLSPDADRTNDGQLLVSGSTQYLSEEMFQSENSPWTCVPPLPQTCGHQGCGNLCSCEQNWPLVTSRDPHSPTLTIHTCLSLCHSGF